MWIVLTSVTGLPGSLANVPVMVLCVMRGDKGGPTFHGRRVRLTRRTLASHLRLTCRPPGRLTVRMLGEPEWTRNRKPDAVAEIVTSIGVPLRVEHLEQLGGGEPDPLRLKSSERAMHRWMTYPTLSGETRASRVRRMPKIRLTRSRTAKNDV